MTFIWKLSMPIVFCFYNLLSVQYAGVDGIQCFQCNSANNSDCVDLKVYHGVQSILPTHCDESYGNSAFCRKTVIQVIDKVKKFDTRVIRSCGWIEHKNPCYKTDNEGHNEKVCQCFTDFCNSAPSSAALVSALLLVPLFLIFKNILL